MVERIISVALRYLLVAVIAAAMMHSCDQREYRELDNQFVAYKTLVDAAGQQAKREKAAKEAQDKKLKEKTDREHQAALGDLRARVKRLRDERDRAAADILPRTPTGSSCPEGQACFDRAELERALREYRSRVRGLVDEGSEVTIDLDAAAKWAQDIEERK